MMETETSKEDQNVQYVYETSFIINQGKEN